MEGSVNWGYARVSSTSQRLDRQLEQLRVYGIDERHIKTEKQSGKDFERPEFLSLVGNGILYVPVSKLNLELNKTVVPSQILACYSDRTRTLLKKTPRGTATIPFGGILQR